MTRKRRIYKRSGETRICQYCGDEYYLCPSQLLTRKSCGKKECKHLAKTTGEMIKCLTCGNSVYSLPSNPRKYCSIECSENSHRIEATCPQCGVLIKARKSRNQKYCSNKCQGLAKRTGEFRNCPSCNVEFWTTPYHDTKYCKKCFNVATKIKGEYRTCICGCKKSFWASPSMPRKYYSSECFWNNTISKDPNRNRPYNREFGAALKRAVRKRDKHTCQSCQKPQSLFDPKLSIHHIDYDKTNNDFANLISLCIVCHGKTNTRRKYWENKFRGDDIVRAMRRRIELDRNDLARV